MSNTEIVVIYPKQFTLHGSFLRSKLSLGWEHKNVSDKSSIPKSKRKQENIQKIGKWICQEIFQTA